jgi:hypothetical protein
MAGTAPTDFHFTKTLHAGPVHCNVWLCHRRTAHELAVTNVDQGTTGIEG